MGVFSAQAEVFLSVDLKCNSIIGFLRASGGVSNVLGNIEDIKKFSPRKRRCFSKHKRSAAKSAVFSAQAEVFLAMPFSSVAA